MYTLYRNFENIESHTRSARQLYVPHIPLYALDIEYNLKTKHCRSVYLYTRQKNSPLEVGRLRSLIQEMVLIWVETNFVVEAHVLHIDQMLDVKKARYEFPFWKRRYNVVSQRPEWTWRQSENFDGRKQPEVKSMLIIDGVHNLVPLTSPRHVEVLEKIRKIARKMEERDGDRFYLITTGALSDTEWAEVLATDDIATDTIGLRWSDYAALMLPHGSDLETSILPND